MGLAHSASRLSAVAVLAVLAVTGAGTAQAGAVPTVEVRDLTVDVDRDLGSQFGGRVDVTVHFRVANTGSEPVQPTTRIELESQIGGGTTSAPIAMPPIAAGDHVDVVRTAGSLLPFGGAHVVVTVRTGDEMTTASASTPVIPWLLLLAVLVVVVVVVAVVVGIVTRRKTRSKAPEFDAAGRHS